MTAAVGVVSGPLDQRVWMRGGLILAEREGPLAGSVRVHAPGLSAMRLHSPVTDGPPGADLQEF